MRFLAISRPPSVGEVHKTMATITARTIPDGFRIYSFDYPIRCIAGNTFRPGLISCDGLNVIVMGSDKGNRDAIYIFNTRTGSLNNKIPLKHSTVKDILSMVPMPHKPNLVALIDPDKGSILDIRSKRIVRTIPKWGGSCTKDGKYGLYAPSRGGLELLELKKGHLVKTFIPKVAEGVFTVICMFNKTDEYVLYYHSGKKTLRVFR
ncbi:unnamed protein product [Timema podura]|uniref:NWD2 C-terminal beta-propeller domain-containing protein n=1 Tax=Timema podura TaxID=61482 RepID=A0ABN7PAE4_TIMPD|nr:unnamed protein product [Timema podura]